MIGGHIGGMVGTKIIYEHALLTLATDADNNILAHCDGFARVFILSTPDITMTIAKALIDTLPLPDHRGFVYDYHDEEKGDAVQVDIERGRLNIMARDEYSSRDAYLPLREIDVIIRALVRIKFIEHASTCDIAKNVSGGHCSCDFMRRLKETIVK